MQGGGIQLFAKGLSAYNRINVFPAISIITIAVEVYFDPPLVRTCPLDASCKTNGSGTTEFAGITVMTPLFVEVRTKEGVSRA